MTENSDLVDGYLDGMKDDRVEFPETLSNRGEQYKHGWLNGRDDRLGTPRAAASTIRSSYEIAVEKDKY